MGPKNVEYAGLAVESLLKHTSCGCIYLIAPASVHERLPTSDRVRAVDEDSVVPGVKIAALRERFRGEGYPEHLANWYFQQFLKICAPSGIVELADRYVIWDSDTVLVRDAEFYGEDGEILLARGEDGIHEPYYATLDFLFGGPVKRTSYIAQYFPTYRDVSADFIACIESVHPGKSWINTLLDYIFSLENTDKSYSSLLCFSEYNSLGTFIEAGKCARRLRIIDIPWYRNGSEIGRYPLRSDLRRFARKYVYIAFENPYKAWPIELRKKFSRMLPAEFRIALKRLFGRS